MTPADWFETFAATARWLMDVGGIAAAVAVVFTGLFLMGRRLNAQIGSAGPTGPPLDDLDQTFNGSADWPERKAS